MKKISLLIISSILFFSCKPSADQYFGTAVLNCNTFSRFGSYEIKEFLAGPPQTYNVDKKIMEPSSFQEYFKSWCVDNAIENYDKVKSLPVTDETRSMITASLALYEFCVSKYQKDYMQIAKMKDDNRAQAEIDAALKKVDDTYIKEFAKKYDGAWSEGLVYAKANGIEVNTVNSSPQFK
ncbi:MAG: hypothetical protein ABIN89_30555 [Chitinophagaceae bacterium]